MIELKVKKLHPDAIIPTYATDGSACFDLHSAEAGIVDELGATVRGTGGFGSTGL